MWTQMPTSQRDVPNVLLLDAGEVPRPCTVSAFSGSKARATKERAVQAEGEGVWVSRTDRDMPGLADANFLLLA